MQAHEPRFEFFRSFHEMNVRDESLVQELQTRIVIWQESVILWNLYSCLILLCIWLLAEHQNFLPFPRRICLLHQQNLHFFFLPLPLSGFFI
jgi:hypothetical protein